MPDYFGSTLYTIAPSPDPGADYIKDLAFGIFRHRLVDINETGNDRIALYLTASQGTDQAVLDAFISSVAGSAVGSNMGYGVGLITVGEIRSGSNDPGSGFSGVRLGTSPYGSSSGFTYSGSQWNIVGVDNDVLQFGLSASNGKALAGGGNVILGSDGITLLAGSNSINRVKWTDGGSSGAAGLIYTDNAASTYELIFNAFGPHKAGYDGEITLNAQSDSGLDTALELFAGSQLTRATTGTFRIQQDTQTSGSPFILDLQGAAHTTLSASTEVRDVLFGLAREVQWATGDIAEQRAISIAAPTYKFVGNSTITNTATVHIDNAPQAGTNATITNSYALWINAGSTRLDGTLLIQQDGTSGSRIQIADPDIAHGMTALANTAHFAEVNRFGTCGGVQLRGLSGSTTGLQLVGIAASPDTARATTATATVLIRSSCKNGTGQQAAGANENLLAIQSLTTTRFIFDSDGDFHADAAVSASSYDAYDDVAMVRSLEVLRVPDLREAFGEWVKYKRDDLQRAGVATFNDDADGDGSIFINYTALARLHSGALWQTAQRVERLERLATKIENVLRKIPFIGKLLLDDG